MAKKGRQAGKAAAMQTKFEIDQLGIVANGLRVFEEFITNI